jgi:hypothetical protein
VIGCTGCGVLNVASGEPLSARDAAQLCFRALGIKENFASEQRSQPVSRRAYDASRLRREIPGVSVRPVAQAIEELVALCA